MRDFGKMFGTVGALLSLIMDRISILRQELISIFQGLKLCCSSLCFSVHSKWVKNGHNF